MPFEDFKREALKLPRDERAQLADVLYRSLDEEEDAPAAEAKLPAEIRRRYEAFKEGKAKLLSYEELFAGLD